MKGVYSNNNKKKKKKKKKKKSPVLTPMDLNPCAHEILEDTTSILT